MLSVSAREVSDATGIGLATIKRYEASAGIPPSRKGHLATLKRYFEAAGIEFVGTPDDRPGIRLGRPSGQGCAD